MLKSSLCDYSDAYTLVKEKIIITRAGAGAARQADERNNTQVEYAKDLGVVMPMYNLI